MSLCTQLNPTEPSEAPGPRETFTSYFLTFLTARAKWLSSRFVAVGSPWQQEQARDSWSHAGHSWEAGGCLCSPHFSFHLVQDSRPQHDAAYI